VFVVLVDVKWKQVSVVALVEVGVVGMSCPIIRWFSPGELDMWVVGGVGVDVEGAVVAVLSLVVAWVEVVVGQISVVEAQWS
jgi:hypothetical protein